jgi:PEP-CTERM motif
VKESNKHEENEGENKRCWFHLRSSKGGIMKKVVVNTLFATWCLSAVAQGTVNFINLNVPNGLNAPVYHSDGVTPLSGAQFQAQLLGGPSSSNMVTIATAAFLQGSGAGYFDGGEQTISTVPGGGTAWVEVEVWNTASGLTFAQAQASGLADSWWHSSVFTVQTGCPNCINPSAPALLVGLGNSPVFLNAIPEPSTLALVGLGLAIILLRLAQTERNARR